MEIDQEYRRKVLNSFIESERSFVWIAAIAD